MKPRAATAAQHSIDHDEDPLDSVLGDSIPHSETQPLEKQVDTDFFNGTSSAADWPAPKQYFYNLLFAFTYYILLIVYSLSGRFRRERYDREEGLKCRKRSRGESSAHS